MDSTTLWRAGGWAAIVGGVLLVVDFTARLAAPGGPFEPLPLAGLPHEVWNLPLMVGAVLLIFGLAAVWLYQAGPAGRLGLAGFVLLTIGLAVGVVYSAIFHGLFLPDLARHLTPAEIEAILTDPTAGQVVRGVVVMGLGLGLGAILFGVATLRARVLPVAGGWLLIAGAALSAASELALILRALGMLSFAVAFVLFGLVVRHGPQVPAPAPDPPEPGG